MLSCRSPCSAVRSMPPTNARVSSTTMIFSWWQCIVRSRLSSAQRTWLSRTNSSRAFFTTALVGWNSGSGGPAQSSSRTGRRAATSASRSRSGRAPGPRVSSNSGDACHPAMCTERCAPRIAASISASADVPSTSTSTLFPERTGTRVDHHPGAAGASASDQPSRASRRRWWLRSTASRPSPTLESTLLPRDVCTMADIVAQTLPLRCPGRAPSPGRAGPAEEPDQDEPDGDGRTEPGRAGTWPPPLPRPVVGGWLDLHGSTRRRDRVRPGLPGSSGAATGTRAGRGRAAVHALHRAAGPGATAGRGNGGQHRRRHPAGPRPHRRLAPGPDVSPRTRRPASRSTRTTTSTVGTWSGAATRCGGRPRSRAAPTSRPSCTPRRSAGAEFNQSKQLWAGLEDYVLDHARTYRQRLDVFTGPSSQPTTRRTGGCRSRDASTRSPPGRPPPAATR